MNKSLVFILAMMFMIVPLTYAGDCISSSNCVNNSDINDSTMCEFTIDVPDGMDQVFIDVDSGSRFYSGRHWDMVVDNDDTNFSLYVDRETLPVYMICSEASSNYEREQYIEMFTLGIDDDYSQLPVNNDYQTIERDDATGLVIGGVLLIIGLLGMLLVLISFFGSGKK